MDNDEMHVRSAPILISACRKEEKRFIILTVDANRHLRLRCDAYIYSKQIFYFFFRKKLICHGYWLDLNRRGRKNFFLLLILLFPFTRVQAWKSSLDAVRGAGSKHENEPRQPGSTFDAVN